MNEGLETKTDENKRGEISCAPLHLFILWLGGKGAQIANYCILAQFENCPFQVRVWDL